MKNLHFTTVLDVRRARSDERVVSRRDLPNLPCGKEKKKFYRGAAFSKSSGLSSSSQQIFSAAFLSSSSQQLFSAALLSSSSQQLFSAALLSSSSQQLFSAAFLSSSSQQLFSAAFLSSSYQQLFSAAFLSSSSQQLFSAAFLSSSSQQLFSADFLSSSSQQLFSAALLSSYSQQPFSAALLSSSSQQIFSAALLSSSSQQLFSTAILSSLSQQLFSAALLSYHLAVVRGWWSSMLPFFRRTLSQRFREKVLEKGDGHNHHREGYYSWWGPHCNKRTGMNSGVEHLLFSIEDEFTEISGFYLGYGYGLSAPQNLWRYPLQLPGSKYTTTV